VAAIGTAFGVVLCAAFWVPVCSDASEGEPAWKPVLSQSVSVNRVIDVPEYARPLGSGVSHLDFGLESRWRYESRQNDYSSPALDSDDALVSRSLLYIGLKEVIDPLRFAFELQDARRFLSDRAPDPRVSDYIEPIQALAQLYFPQTLAEMPLRLSFGRMTLDAVDRRLITRNRNRNTINTFDGLRLRLGDETKLWEVESFALRPMLRNVECIKKLDKEADDVSLYGLIGYLRELSPGMVLEPYWLWLDQRRAPELALRRNLHTLGLHAYGQWGHSHAWDYDLSVAGQFGEAQSLKHRAFAAHAELGHTFIAPYSPRLAAWLNYASGDKNARDSVDNRFDPLFGASYAFYGYTSYFVWQNVVNPSLRFSVQPAKTLRCELIYRAYWLASSVDEWARGGNRRDATGRSGSFVGQELDARVVWQISKHLEMDASYGHFMPGGFVKATGAARAAHLLQVATTLRF
jgi:hypothetical protein